MMFKLDFLLEHALCVPIFPCQINGVNLGGILSFLSLCLKNFRSLENVGGRIGCLSHNIMLRLLYKLELNVWTVYNICSHQCP